MYSLAHSSNSPGVKPLKASLMSLPSRLDLNVTFSKAPIVISLRILTSKKVITLEKPD